MGATAADLAELSRVELEPAGHYFAHGGRLCRRRNTKDGEVIDSLCNSTARVVEEIVSDDGAEMTRAFVVEGQLDSGSRLPPIRVPASRFPGMARVMDGWELRAVVRAGMATRDSLREAIQTLSSAAASRHVFTHTGWRSIGDCWIYLTASGALGAPGYEVDLGPDLARYALPAKAEDAPGAMRESLTLLRGKIAPMKVMVPLWAAIYRAPKAAALPIDVSVWIEGTTGSLKSTVAALALAHYGPFDRLRPSRVVDEYANQLERRAFLLKDTVFVIDDYAPSSMDTRELELRLGDSCGRRVTVPDEADSALTLPSGRSTRPAESSW
jgi:hypothetical protein